MVSDRRLDFLHKLGTRLMRKNQVVCIEDLNVSGMVKNRKLSRAIADAGWRTFRMLLEYKAELYGRALRVVSCWEPTSQRCSTCGDRGSRKNLSVRRWKCSVCGTEHDRDVNATKNILATGLADEVKHLWSRRKTGSPALGNEAGTHLNREVQRCAA